MATQRSRQTWQTSSLLNVSTNSLPKSKASVKRSVTPNSRAHNAGDATDKAAAVAVKQRSVTPVSRSFSNGESEKQTSGVVKVPASKRAVTPLGRVPSIIARDPEPGRVRVAVRLRPRNAEDLASDADFADCVELQPELKKLNLRKNNWNSESYKFDEVFTETASQKRVYQVVTKPVVESVLSGYNGTIMAYGQTGTGKTYTVGNMGKIDESERGIVVRAVEDILSNTSPPNDSVEVSYLQLYMESVQDLLAPEKVNIPIIEDPKSGEVSVPGAEVVKIQDIDDFMELLRMGETNRHAANTKMNTNSSRSHAVLMVHIKRSVVGRTETAATSHERVTGSNGQVGNEVRMIRKSKLLIVDLAGSERIDKSGSEGQLLEEAKFINLSLTTLGKCINALAENSAHIPTRESKLTRLLRDSFGGSARTSLIITIGPSARHHAETTSTIMFGQRAMKVVNMMKVKEEFDYESLSRKLESQVDHLTKEIDRQQKLRDNYINQMEKKLKECQHSFAEAEKSLVARSEMLEKENARLEMEIKALQDESEYQKDCNKLLCDQVARLEMSLEHFKQKQQDSTTYQKALADTNQMHENQIAELIEQLEDERACCEGAEKQTHSQKELLRDHENLILQYQEENSRYQKEFSETKQTYEKQIMQLLKQLEDEHSRCVDTEEQVHSLKKLLGERNSDQKVLSETMEMYEKQIAELTTKLQDEHAEREHAEEQVDSLKKVLSDQNSVQNQEKSEGNDLKIKVEGMERTHHATLAELQSLKEEYATLLSEKEKISGELDTVKDKLLKEEKQRITLENELVRLEKLAHENNEDVGEKKSYMKPHSRGSSSFKAALGLNRSISVQRAGVAKIFEEAGLEKILSLLSSEDVDIQMHALKVVANLAAEDGNQEKIVNDGGLDALLMLLQTSQNTTILRVASGAVANLAMNENNQGLIMSKGGAQLLASTASKTEDPQTLRMVAGAIANLCGNVNLHTTLKQDGGLKALLGMARIGNADVIAQVARGLANFAKCETREVVQGRRKGRSLLMEDGAFAWLIVNSKTTSDSTRRHIELALCHLAQNEDNARDFIATGGLKEVMRISNESVREDIRNLAKKTLKLNPSFQAQFPTNR